MSTAAPGAAAPTANKPSRIDIQAAGLTVGIERTPDGFRAEFFSPGRSMCVLILWGDQLRFQEDPAWPAIWVGDTACIDVDAEMLEVVRIWHAGLPPRRAVMRLADRPEATHIPDAAAIAAASEAQYGALCDGRR